MKKRIITALIILAAVIGAFAFRLIPDYGVYVFDLLIGLVAIFSAMEMSKLLFKMKVHNSSTIVGLSPSFFFAGHMLSFMFELPYYFWLAIQGGILVFVFLLDLIISLSVKAPKEYAKENKFKYAIKNAAGTLCACVYPTLLFSAFMYMNRLDETSFAFIESFGSNFSWLILVVAILVPVITDIFAMLCGKLLKGKKLCPKLSPNKTISGAVCAVTFSGIIMGAAYYLFNVFSFFKNGFAANSIYMWHFVLLGVLASVVAQVGDLFESFLKRKAGVKDSGVIFPGHGGMLDRLDSHLFAAPFTLAFFALLFII